MTYELYIDGEGYLMNISATSLAEATVAAESVISRGDYTTSQTVKYWLRDAHGNHHDREFRIVRHHWVVVRPRGDVGDGVDRVGAYETEAEAKAAADTADGEYVEYREQGVKPRTA